MGTCKLCLREAKELQESHHIPRALHPKRLKQQFATRSKTGPVKDEIKAYVLCRECEERFNQNGESEVLRHLAAKTKDFSDLHRTLRFAPPREEHPDVMRFAGHEVDCHMDKFAYFAMSIVWRGCVHDWTMLDGEVRPASPMGDFQEQIRRYLLGETCLPPDMVVLVIVCSDKQSRNVWMIPKEEVAENCINVRFLLRGILFRVLIGHQMPDFYRGMCCTSPRKCLFYGNASHRVPEIMAVFDLHTQDR
jgi:hypothetical protein